MTGILWKNPTQDIFTLRAKFNDALNDVAARHENCILTINSCNTPEHFTKEGKLSEKGRSAFWHEIDDLFERFDLHDVKLLPNPVNHQKTVFPRKHCK